MTERQEPDVANPQRRYDVQLTVRLSKADQQRIEQLAIEDGRSVANYIRRVLRDHVGARA